MTSDLDSKASIPQAAIVVLAIVLSLLFFFFAYYPRTALTIQESDGAEFALAAVKGSLVHPPGYPLYSWLAELVVKIFPANPYHALAVFSAICQALAVGLLVPVLFGLSRSLILAVALSIGWGLYEPSIRTAVDVEVFALHHLLVVACVGLAVLGSRANRNYRVILLAFGTVLGLAAAHQHLIVLFLPLLLGILLQSRKQPDFSVQSILNPLIGVAALLYLSLFLRYQHAPQLAFAPLVSGIDFISYLLRGGYGTFSLVLEGSATGVSYSSLMMTSLAQGVPAALVLALFLLPLVVWRRGAALWGGVVTLALAIFFGHGLILPPPEGEYREWVMRFFPTIALAVVLTGALAFSYLNSLRFAAALTLSVVTLVFGGLCARDALARADLSNDSAVADEVTELLNNMPFGAVLVVGSDRLVFGLDYDQAVLNLRPDVLVVSVGKLESPSYRKRLLENLNANPRIKHEALGDLSSVVGLALIASREVFAEPTIDPPAGLSASRSGVFTNWYRGPAPHNVQAQGEMLLQLCGRWPNSLSDVPRERVRSRQILERAFIDPFDEYILAHPQSVVTPLLIEALRRYRSGDITSARTFCEH